MSTSAADPVGLHTFGSRSSGARTDIADALPVLTSRLADLAAALPEGFTIPAAPDISGYLSRIATADDHVSALAVKFELAGRGEDGRAVLDSSALADTPFVSPYDEALRQALIDRAAEELATLQERIRTGDADQTTIGELVATLGLLRHAIDTAPDPQAQAAELLAPMGPRDLDRALALLEEAAIAEGHDSVDDWSVAGIADLGHIVSLGLEDQPARAERWADELMSRRDTYHDEDAADDLTLLSAFTAPDTHTLAAALFVPLNTLGRTSDGGLPEQILGTRSPVKPILDDATCRPELANAVVEQLLDQGQATSQQGHQTTAFDLAFSVLADQDTRYQDISPEQRATLLQAAVSPALDDETRAATSLHLADYVTDNIDGAKPVYGYDPAVLEALGASLQPALEHTYGFDQTVQIGDTAHPAGPVFDAAAYLATTDGGSAGVARAVDGFVANRIADAAATPDRVAATGQPVEIDSLDDIGYVFDGLVGATSQRQVSEMLQAIEAGGAGPAAEAALLGSFELTPQPVVGEILGALRDYHGNDVANSGSPVAPDLQARASLHLLDATLAGRPELATPAVLEAFERAAARSGVPGMHGMLESPERYWEVVNTDGALPDAPTAEMFELARLYNEQSNQLDLSHGALIARVVGDD